MKTRLLLPIIVLCFALCGCGGSLKDKLVGAWKIDPASVKSAAIDQAKADPKMAEQIHKNVVSAIFTFKSDGTFIVSSTLSANTQGGKWTLDGTNLTMTGNNQPANAAKPKFTINADGTRIHMSAPGVSPLDMDLVKGD